MAKNSKKTKVITKIENVVNQQNAEQVVATKVCAYNNITVGQCFSRFFATFIDMFLYTFIVAFGISMLTEILWMTLGVNRPHLYAITVVSYIAAFFLMAKSISISGDTVGKKLMKIKIMTNSGKFLTNQAAINREFSMLFCGLWLNVPIISFIGMLFSYNRLRSTGSTTWDDKNDSKVEYGEVGIFRWIVAITLSILICLLSLI